MGQAEKNQRNLEERAEVENLGGFQDSDTALAMEGLV